jgi:hypothetical protein
MSTVALAVFLLIRVILPFVLLIGVGEWVRRRETSYWFHQ